MEVTVRVFGEPARLLGKRHRLELDEGSTVRTVANRLADKVGQKRYGYLGRYRVGGGDLSILVNGRNIELLEGVDTVLGDDDEVVILVPTVGG